MKIAIIDYGAGNTKSVYYAFKNIGIEPVVTKDKVEIKKAQGVVFPGVGHAVNAMNCLKSAGLDKLIPELSQPVLGICLGMQLQAQFTEEGNQKGLGIIPVDVKRFNEELKVPQMGWNLIKCNNNSLFEGLTEEPFYAYFVHSYYIPLNNSTIATTDYGVEFSAASQINNFYGCQFHPEKSGEQGLTILKNFIKICESYQQ